MLDQHLHNVSRKAANHFSYVMLLRHLSMCGLRDDFFVYSCHRVSGVAVANHYLRVGIPSVAFAELILVLKAVFFSACP